MEKFNVTSLLLFIIFFLNSKRCNEAIVILNTVYEKMQITYEKSGVILCLKLSAFGKCYRDGTPSLLIKRNTCKNEQTFKVKKNKDEEKL